MCVCVCVCVCVYVCVCVCKCVCVCLGVRVRMHIRVLKEHNLMPVSVVFIDLKKIATRFVINICAIIFCDTLSRTFTNI